MVDANLLTVSEVSDCLDESPQRVAYVIRKCRIKPAQRVGLIRLFGPEQIGAIKEGLCNLQVRDEPAHRSLPPMKDCFVGIKAFKRTVE